MATTHAEPFTERQCRAIQRILDQMDRAATRTETQYSRARQHERKPYRGPISIFVPPTNDAVPPLDGAGCPVGWAYSLSQGGMGFIALEVFPAEEIYVGIHLANGAIRWMRGRTVRTRVIPEEQFIDHGIAFGAPPAGTAAQ